MDDIEVRLPIRLGQFVKLASLADSGAQARDMIEAGDILVNGEVETHRGHHLDAGDVVTLVLPNQRIDVRVTAAL